MMSDHPDNCRNCELGGDPDFCGADPANEEPYVCTMCDRYEAELARLKALFVAAGDEKPQVCLGCGGPAPCPKDCPAGSAALRECLSPEDAARYAETRRRLFGEKLITSGRAEKAEAENAKLRQFLGEASRRIEQMHAALESWQAWIYDGKTKSYSSDAADLTSAALAEPGHRIGSCAPGDECGRTGCPECQA